MLNILKNNLRLYVYTLYNRMDETKKQYTDAQKRATQKYRENNKDKINAQRKKYYQERKEKDPSFLEYKRQKAKEYYAKKKFLISTTALLEYKRQKEEQIPVKEPEPEPEIIIIQEPEPEQIFEPIKKSKKNKKIPDIYKDEKKVIESSTPTEIKEQIKEVKIDDIPLVIKPEIKNKKTLKIKIKK